MRGGGHWASLESYRRAVQRTLFSVPDTVPCLQGRGIRMPCLRKAEELAVHISGERSLGSDSPAGGQSAINLVIEKEVEGARLSAWQTQQAKRYMIQNMGSGLLISAVAQACHLSRSHFSRAFRNTTGSSPRDWIRRARLIRAANLLAQTDRAIAQVALECGFADQSHLTRAFAKTLGTSPGKWRALRKVVGDGHSPLSHFLG